MPDHLIRLRGAWEWQDLSGEPAILRRVTLPIAWPQGQAGPVRLVRRFNGPPLDPRSETLSLRLEKVPGLRAVRLNGLAFEGPLEERLTLDLESFGPLAAKYVLTLEVDPTAAARAGGGWGEIVLVVGASGRIPGSPGETA